MAKHRKPRSHDRKGRSTRTALLGLRPKVGPGECGVKQFAWLPRELLESDAWRGLSPNSRKLMDRLLLEHLGHAATENGRLIVTHENFATYGLTPCKIRDAISECVAFGLIRMKQGGRWAGTNRPNTFRVTWLGWWDEDGDIRDPTNDWKGVTRDRVKEYKSELAEIRRSKRRRKTAELN